MFDYTSAESYNNVSNWYNACQDVFDIPIVMLGNKQDDPGRVIEPRMIKFHQYKSNIQYWDLSVKNSIDIEKPFPWFIRKLLGYHNIKIIQQPEMKSETGKDSFFQQQFCKINQSRNGMDDNIFTAH